MKINSDIPKGSASSVLTAAESFRVFLSRVFVFFSLSDRSHSQNRCDATGSYKLYMLVYIESVGPVVYWLQYICHGGTVPFLE